MRLAAVYNVFSDSIELLKASILQIHPFLHKVIVVYQNVSNHGQQASPEMLPYLEYLKSEGLIDELVEYKPPGVGNGICHRNENEKRILGKEKAWLNGCTHYLLMDSDEFYNRNEFARAIDIIESKKYDATALHIQDFHVKPTYKVANLANYFVPFIHAITTSVALGAQYFEYTDPTRRAVGWSKSHTFKPNVIKMNHMTSVRLDLTKKYENSSSRRDFKNIPAHVNSLLRFKPEHGNPKVEVVDDEFGVQRGIDEFVEWRNKFEQAK